MDTKPAFSAKDPDKNEERAKGMDTIPSMAINTGLFVEFVVPEKHTKFNITDSVIIPTTNDIVI